MHPSGRLRVVPVLLALCLAALAGRTACGQTVTPVPQLDLNKLLGTWYEVAHLPNKAEKKCVRDAITLIALGDKPGRFTEVDSCKYVNGYNNVRNVDGRRQDKRATDGRLKTGSFWPFYKKYWVLAMDDDSILVGAPNRKSLWLLTKSANPAPEVLAGLKAKAQAQGFDLTKLVAVPQTR